MNKPLVQKTKENVIGRLAAIKATPKQIAGGYALGILVGSTPLLGIKAGIAAGVAWLFRCSPLAAFIGAYHINPLIWPVFYTLTFWLGHFFVGGDIHFIFPEHFDKQEMMQLIMSSGPIFLSLTIGGLIVGIPGAVFFYLASYKVLVKLQKRDRDRA